MHKITHLLGQAARNEHYPGAPRHSDFEAAAEENDQLNEI
jgi:hypothetical protein